MATIRAHAKVNLFLNVLAREADGFHQIETLFCLLDLHDELTIEAGSPGLSLEVEGEPTGPARENLVWRAAEAFFVRSGIRPDAHIRLCKRIPVGSGLGGGSSDAAATLHTLNAMHGGPLDRAVLLSIGATLGSDVSFFVARVPLALGWGRGERLLAVPSPGPLPALIAAPAESTPTAAAYAALGERRATRTTRIVPAVHTLQTLRTWAGIGRIASNDFEALTAERLPVVRTIIDASKAAGALIAMLSGSGSSCFAIFDTVHVRDETVVQLRLAHPDVRFVTTRCGVDPPELDV